MSFGLSYLGHHYTKLFIAVPLPFIAIDLPLLFIAAKIVHTNTSPVVELSLALTQSPHRFAP